MSSQSSKSNTRFTVKYINMRVRKTNIWKFVSCTFQQKSNRKKTGEKEVEKRVIQEGGGGEARRLGRRVRVGGWGEGIKSCAMYTQKTCGWLMSNFVWLICLQNRESLVLTHDSACA